MVSSKHQIQFADCAKNDGSSRAYPRTTFVPANYIATFTHKRLILQSLRVRGALFLLTRELSKQFQFAGSAVPVGSAYPRTTMLPPRRTVSR